MKSFLLIFCVALIFSATHAQTISVADLLNQVSKDSLTIHVNQLAEAGGYFSRVNYTPGNQFTVQYLEKYFRSLPGIDSVAVDTFYIYSAQSPYNSKPVMNVIAIKEGAVYPDELVICGGHYDASGSHENNWSSAWQTIKAQGADDNASGVAAIMELARILSDPQNDVATKRTIKFIAFGAEEYHPAHQEVHHAGSLWDADRIQKTNQNLYGALILDMIGYNPNANYCEVISNDQSMWMTDAVYDNLQQHVPDLTMNNVPVDVPYSDHQSYQDFGYPAILLMENDRPWNDQYPYYSSNPYYHSTGDKPETINFDQVKLVTQLSLATLLDYAGIDSATSIDRHNNEFFARQFDLKTFPNPFNARLTISFRTNGQPLTIDIFNARGQFVERLVNHRLFAAGRHYVQWQANNLASGLYLVQIQSAHITVSQKVILIK
ncbi:M20/M25/M40 family metallo-hydrolase [Caldithrix abyssi]